MNKLRNNIFLCSLAALCVGTVIAAPKQSSKSAMKEAELYVSTSFHEPANEGLRFIYSRDAMHWDTIPGTFLAPRLGMKIMRDPSILRTPDGMYHLVWTIAWKNDKRFGYAESRDLVHWSEQKYMDLDARHFHCQCLGARVLPGRQASAGYGRVVLLRAKP